MERSKKERRKTVTFDLTLNQIHEVPGYDETRIPILIRKRKKTTQNKDPGEMQKHALKDDEGNVIFIPSNGLFL